MKTHVYEHKKMVHYDRKGYRLRNKSTLFFDKNLKHPPSKVGCRYEIFAQKDITLNRQFHKKIPLMFGIRHENGIALVNLRESIKSKLDYFNHSMMISESADNVKMEIFNNTNSDVIVKNVYALSISLISEKILLFFLLNKNGIQLRR